jgi:hypothetical protein
VSTPVCTPVCTEPTAIGASLDTRPAGRLPADKTGTTGHWPVEETRAIVKPHSVTAEATAPCLALIFGAKSGSTVQLKLPFHTRLFLASSARMVQKFICDIYDLRFAACFQIVEQSSIINRKS